MAHLRPDQPLLLCSRSRPVHHPQLCLCLGARLTSAAAAATQPWGAGARKAAAVSAASSVTAAAADEPALAASGRADAQAAKDALLTWIGGTNRGAAATKQLRGQIEEAQVAVEALAPAELDYSLLEVPIVGFGLQLPLGLPAPVTVGNVYQQFSCVEQGSVKNIIEFSVPFVLQQQQGVTFTVEASYEVCSGRRIALVFDEAQLGKVRISPGLEALMAPALLPRGYLNQQLLLAIKEFKLVFPFRSAKQVAQGSRAAAQYLLTYLDENMLIGRASGSAGTFVFRRMASDQE